MREKHAEFRVTASTRSGGALPGTGRSRRLLAVDHPRRRELEDISRLLATGRCSTDDLELFGRQAHCFRHLGIVEELLSHIGIAGDDGSFDSRSIPIGTPVTSAANSRGRGDVKHRRVMPCAPLIVRKVSPTARVISVNPAARNMAVTWSLSCASICVFLLSEIKPWERGRGWQRGWRSGFARPVSESRCSA